MRTARLLLIATVALALLSACNTISGMGQDIKKAGEVITDSAEDSRGG